MNQQMLQNMMKLIEENGKCSRSIYRVLKSKHDMDNTTVCDRIRNIKTNVIEVNTVKQQAKYVEELLTDNPAGIPEYNPEKPGMMMPSIPVKRIKLTKQHGSKKRKNAEAAATNGPEGGEPVLQDLLSSVEITPIAVEYSG